MDEKRGTKRRRVLKGAIAAFNGRCSTYSCTVRDISDTGCRLLVDDALMVPEFFDLLIELDAVMIACQVVRRSPTELGVHFIGPMEPTAVRRSQVLQAAVPAQVPLRISLRRT